MVMKEAVIAIEQAKGLLCERGRVDMADAFLLLRTYSRRHNLQLSVVATELGQGTIPIQAVIGPRGRMGT
jgi:hypothetical protein